MYFENIEPIEIGEIKLQAATPEGPKEITFSRVVVVKDENRLFYAHSLDIGQVGTGMSVNQAIEDLFEHIDWLLTESSKNPKRLLKVQAPKEIVKMYNNLKKLSKHKTPKSKFVPPEQLPPVYQNNNVKVQYALA